MRLLEILIRIAKKIENINHHEAKNKSLLAEIVYRQRLSSCKNDFAKKYAKKHFSQTDEDGITIEIINRIKSTKKTFSNTFASLALATVARIIRLFFYLLDGEGPGLADGHSPSI